MIEFTAKQQYKILDQSSDDRANSRQPRAPERHEVFIGRDSELAQIDAAFGNGGLRRVSIVAVQGMAGVGKTYLAREFYARHLGRFGSYQHVVFAPERPGTVAAWITALGEQAGIEMARINETAVAEVLRAQRTLVHVDNVDSIAAAELVAAFAGVLVGVSIIVTGRYTDLGTAKGSGWTRIELVPLDPMAALSLLHAELEGADPAVTEAELGELVRQAAGLPLALHLAAGYLRRGVTVERFLMRLRENGLALDPRDPADHVLQERARGVLATSFAISREQILAEADSRAMAWEAALATLGWAPRKGFGRSLGAAITGLDEDSGAFEDFIDTAVQLSLARRLRPEERGTAAWTVHPLLGEFLRARTERREVDARIGTWVMRLVDDTSSDQASRWGDLSTEAMSIGEWLSVATDEIVSMVLSCAWGFATSCGPTGPWLAAARRVPRDGITRGVLWALCQLAFRMGELEDAHSAATEMERLARDAGDDHDRARALGQIADIQFDRGQLDDVLRIRREEQLPIYERLGDSRARAITLRRISDVLAIRGDLDEALRIRREEVLPVMEQLGDARERAITLGRIADVLAIRGELTEALRIHREEVLPVYERLGDAWSRAIAFGRIADVLFARGELDEALRIRREEQLPVYEGLGDVHSRATVFGRIADVLFIRGELDEALRIRREEQLPVYERLGDVRSRATVMGRIADVLFVRGELHEVLRIHREEQLPVYERLGDVRSRAITLGRIANVLFIRGDLDEALRIRREEELPVYERLGDVRSRAITMGQIADVLCVRDEVDEALRIRYEEELPVYKRLGDMAAYRITMGKIVDILGTRSGLARGGQFTDHSWRGDLRGAGAFNKMDDGLMKERESVLGESSSPTVVDLLDRRSGMHRRDEREDEREEKRFDYDIS